MSPRTTRRPVSEMTSSTASTVTSSAARSAATPRPQNADGSAASRGVYADIELDMESMYFVGGFIGLYACGVDP